ncbi:hypothetical protein NHX12_005567 [Muraenolepis orangiensis]|uniref:Uncharacterized protein n=1 Tax=Muraenolepis orangiensis TaxID=630683 RepID=A0A9Q0IAH6_9TELE|nr:hypothetical protein NHX12_005567 [Muraenolepis orangiensis]
MTTVGGVPVPPGPHSPGRPLSSTAVPHPSQALSPGLCPGSSPWPGRSPTSTLESKDSGIIERGSSVEQARDDHLDPLPPPGSVRTNLAPLKDQASMGLDVPAPRNPPPPKRPLPQRNAHTTSSLVLPRPNSVAADGRISTGRHGGAERSRAVG